MNMIRLVSPLLVILTITTITRAQPDTTAAFTPEVARYSYNAIPRDPLASMFFSAAIPGTGQLYNREFGRGFATMGLFYTSVIVSYYLAAEWERMNTDTFYIEEAFGDPPKIHQVTALKPEDEQVGLSTEKKVALVTALSTAAASYVFGILDGYRGARRYNRKLVESAHRPLLTPYLAFGTRSRAGVTLRF